MRTILALCSILAAFEFGAYGAEAAPSGGERFRAEARAIGSVEVTLRHLGPGNTPSLTTFASEDEENAKVLGSKRLADLLGFGDIAPVTDAHLPGTVLGLDGAGCWLLGLEGNRFQELFAPSKEALANLAKDRGADGWLPVPQRVPEQTGTGSISQDPLSAGSVYSASIDSEAHVGLYRLEVTTIPGTGKLRSPATMERQLKESMQRAFSFLQSNQDKMGLSTAVAQRDFTVEAIELTGGKMESACGVAFFIAMMSALHDRPVQPAMVILGDITIQGNIKGLTSIQEPLQVAVDNGALRALVPIANKNQFAALPEEVVEKLELVFFGDADRALRRALASCPKASRRGSSRKPSGFVRATRAFH